MKKSKPKLLQPQEIEVFYIIPALRKHLAMQMKANGMKQTNIADLLGIEDAAVSQYLSNKRGDRIKLDESTKKKVAESAPKIKDRMTLLRETQSLLRFIRSSGALCKIHKQLSDVPIECGANLTHCYLDRN